MSFLMSFPVSYRWLLLATAVSLVIALISMIVAATANATARRLRQRYRSLMRDTEGHDLETLILKTHAAIDALHGTVTTQGTRLDEVARTLQSVARTPKVLRYNAFGEPGNDLSFTIAVIDAEGSGVVISSIFGREESRTYAKPVIKRTSTYALTPEEKEAIESV